MAHIVFDFGEQTMLPSYRRQLGALHFINGLRVDLFGASATNLGINYVFGPP